MQNGVINKEPIVLGSCLLIVSLITYLFIKDLANEMKFSIGIGISLFIRLIASIYAFFLAKKAGEQIAFWTTIVFLFPVIGLFFMYEISPEMKVELQNTDNNNKDGSVNDPEVLAELIERMNSKK
jgi:hypothetical protein